MNPGQPIPAIAPAPARSAGPKKETRASVPPMVPVAVAMASGIVVDRFGTWWGSESWLVIALAAAGLAIGFRGRAWVSVPTLLIAIAAIGAGWHHDRWSDLAPDDLARVASTEPAPAWVRGVVTSVPEYRAGLGPRPDREGYTRFEMSIHAVCDGRAWHPASGGAMVTVSGNRADVSAGDPIEAAGALALLSGPINPGQRDPRDYPRSRGIRLSFSIDDPEGLRPDPSGRPWPWQRWLGRVRTGSEQRLLAILDDQVAPLAVALLLGRRGAIDPEVIDQFASTGMAHLLAISGLHLSAMAGALGVVCLAARMGRKRASGLVLIAVLSYATLVGWMPAVGRAAVMSAAVCAACLLDRCTRPANVLAIAAILTLFINPSYLFGAGWQLSFLAVAVILFGVVPVLRWLGWTGSERLTRRSADPLDDLERRLESRWKRAVRRAFLVPPAMVAASAIIWLACLPLVAWRFHVVAPIGILLNVPLIPMISLAVMSGGLSLLLSIVWEPMAGPSAWFCGVILRGTLAIVDWGDAQPWGHTFVPSPPTGLVIAFYVFLAMAARSSAAKWPRPMRWGSWLGLAGVGAIGAVLVMTPQRQKSPEADVLAVGHGLAVLIQGTDGRAMLYDCGRSGDPTVGRRIIAPALWERRIRRLEAVVLSHADSDHYDGLPDLLDRFTIGEVIIPEGFGGEENPGATAVLDEVNARGVPVRVVSAGEAEALALPSGFEAEALHPPRGWLPDAADNDRSLVLDLSARGRHLLLTGDLDGAGLVEVLAGPARAFDAVLAPHHGGRSANPPWFYDWSSPSVVVASQSAPRAGTRDALTALGLAARGVLVLRTWRDGAIRLRWEPDRLSVQGFLAKGQSDSLATIPGRTSRPLSAGVSVPGHPIRWVIGLGGIGLGLALCAMLAVVEWGAWALIMPGRGIGQSGGLPPPWEPIEIDARDGLRLRGWWLDAAGSGPVGDRRVALVLHGLAEASPAMRPRAELLHRLGWSVLLPDGRGCGRSEGDRTTFSALEADDVPRWLDAVADRLGPGPIAVVCWGRSMGAAIAIRAAAEDDRIEAMVLEAPYADLRSAVAARLARLPIPGASMLAAPLLSRASTLAGTRLDRPRPIDLAGRVDRPTIILHGRADHVVPPSEVRRLANAFPEPDRIEVVEVAGTGHAEVFDRGGESLENRLTAFLNRNATASQDKRIQRISETSLPRNHDV